MSDVKGVAPWVLLAEPRDEVFARLSTDLAQSGLRVVRAVSAAETLDRYADYHPGLVIASRDLADQSVWLLASKLLMGRSAHVWVYLPRKTAVEVSMARFLGIDELLEYGGDLVRLSDAILDSLAGRSAAPGRGCAPKSGRGTAA